MTTVTRKKQPEQVRRNLLRAAADIASEHGLEHVTTAEVARRAGVTSGGLFHHFPSKKHLIDEMVLTCIKHYEKHIEELVGEDPEPRGRFARAYLVSAYTYDPLGGDNKLMGALITAMNRDSGLAELWSDWLKAQIRKYGRESDPVLAAIIRYAADGLWMESFAVPHSSSENRQAAIRTLMEWTLRL